MGKSYEINEEARNALIRYLAGKPYSEVHDGIRALQGLKEIVKEEE